MRPCAGDLQWDPEHHSNTTPPPVSSSGGAHSGTSGRGRGSRRRKRAGSNETGLNCVGSIRAKCSEAAAAARGPRLREAAGGQAGAAETDGAMVQLWEGRFPVSRAAEGPFCGIVALAHLSDTLSLHQASNTTNTSGAHAWFYKFKKSFHKTFYCIRIVPNSLYNDYWIAPSRNAQINEPSWYFWGLSQLLFTATTRVPF